ncbi:hypothetical protein HOY80DRAFT_1138654 [Tuber brumale]|nr:hypothetical protein HOY80DRAFT_1138654 [Tuber brumale]
MDQMFPAGHLSRSDLKLCVDWKVATILRENMEASNLKHVPQYQEPRSGNWINPSGEMLFNAMKCNDWDFRAEDVRAMFLYILLLTRERGRKLSNGQLEVERRCLARNPQPPSTPLSETEFEEVDPRLQNTSDADRLSYDAAGGGWEWEWE